MRDVGKLRDENRKRYPDVKSRYAEPANGNRGFGVAPAQPTNVQTSSVRRRRCGWIDRQISGMDTSGDPRSLQSVVLSPTERAYLNLIEDGRYDRAASAVGYVLLSEAEPGSRVHGPQPLDEAVGALTAATDGDGSTAMALLRAAVAYADRARNGRPRNAEMFLMAALSLLAADDRPDERLQATCLFAAGRIYADVAAYGHDDRARVTAVRFLDWARLAADNHRADWPLPADLRDAIGVREAEHGDGGLWTAACFAEHQVLLETARDLDPVRALRAVRAAYRLLKLCGRGGLRRRASVAFELAARYAAVGSRNLAAEFFDECAADAAAVAGAPHDADIDADIDLEARLEATRMAPRPSSDGVLARIADQALHRRNGRLLAKAIAARARLSADANRLNEAYHRFALAHRLTVLLGTVRPRTASRYSEPLFGGG